MFVLFECPLELFEFQSASESSNDILAFDKTDKKINEEQGLKTEVVTIENLGSNQDFNLKSKDQADKRNNIVKEGLLLC